MPLPYPCPPAGMDWELASEQNWTWADLEGTPVLIRDLWTQLLMARRAHEAEQIRKSSAGSTQGASAADRRAAEQTLAEAEAATADDPEVRAWREQLEREGAG